MFQVLSPPSCHLAVASCNLRQLSRELKHQNERFCRLSTPAAGASVRRRELQEVNKIKHFKKNVLKLTKQTYWQLG